ncbi:orotidine 5'-phosphate decarboxylase / HUMPS family protein [[Eubacterium] cellulosolvens]
MGFKQAIEDAATRNKSPIVLALDLTREDREALFKDGLKLIGTVSRFLCAVKINHQLVLPLGLHDRVATLVAEAHRRGIPAIMDAKINDIGHTNEFIASQYFSAGFDAVIANPFAGYKDGLEPVFRLAKSQQRGVLLLVHMSHRGASEGYGQRVLDEATGARWFQFEVFAQRALHWEADGVIVGATFPETIARVRSILGEAIPIFSPGVGVQGGSLSEAIAAGAKYAIVGRSICESDDPARSADELRRSVALLG